MYLIILRNARKEVEFIFPKFYYFYCDINEKIEDEKSRLDHPEDYTFEVISCKYMEDVVK